MEIQEQKITFKQVLDGYQIQNDDYKICGIVTNPFFIKTMLSNPFLEDYNLTMYTLKIINGVVRARNISFPTKILIEGRVYNSSGGSGLFVEEEARKYALGVSLLLGCTQNPDNNYLLFAGLSKMVLPIYKKMRFSVFSTPLMWQPRRTRFLFQRIGLKGGKLKLATGFSNLFLKTYIAAGNALIKIFIKKYTIRRLTTIPEWVNDIFLKDPHKYSEYHDNKWLQWVIDNRVTEDNRNNRRFYAIYSKDDKPIAFTLIKENHLCLPERNIDDVCFGSIIDWGIMPGAKITELELTKLIMPYFSSDVAIVEFTSDNPIVISRMKKYGFVQHGEAHIGFKDLTKKLDKDSQDIRNWRIRLAYSDVCFY